MPSTSTKIMTANTYLKNLIETIPSYELTPEEQKTIKFEGIEKFILNKLNKSKFKASAIPEVLLEKVKANISKSVAQNRPIHITVPFGGYKKWRFPAYPLPDWAEVFNFILLRDYLMPIAEVYPHGVLLDYFSDEIFVSRMNNYPQKDLDDYNANFQNILKYVERFLPENFKIKYSKIRDEISQEELMKRFEVTIMDLKKKWVELPEAERAYRINKSERNYKGDLSALTAEKKYEILLESTLIHDAFIFGDWDKDAPWAFGEYMIPVGFRYTGTWGIHLKSSRSSTVQFWIGTGVLKVTDGEYVPTILTYNQYLEAKNTLIFEKADVIKVDNPNLENIPLLNI